MATRVFRMNFLHSSAPTFSTHSLSSFHHDLLVLFAKLVALLAVLVRHVQLIMTSVYRRTPKLIVIDRIIFRRAKLGTGYAKQLHGPRSIKDGTCKLEVGSEWSHWNIESWKTFLLPPPKYSSIQRTVVSKYRMFTDFSAFKEIGTAASQLPVKSDKREHVLWTYSTYSTIQNTRHAQCSAENQWPIFQKLICNWNQNETLDTPVSLFFFCFILLLDHD